MQCLFLLFLVVGFVLFMGMGMLLKGFTTPLREPQTSSVGLGVIYSH